MTSFSISLNYNHVSGHNDHKILIPKSGVIHTKIQRNSLGKKSLKYERSVLKFPLEFPMSSIIRARALRNWVCI